VKRTAGLLVVLAAALAALDLAHKALALADGGRGVLADERSLAYALGAAVAALALGLALVTTRSLLLATAGGVVVGGALANVISLALWPSYDGVPNPFFAGNEVRGIAFNLADVFLATGGFLLLPAATLVFAARNRERLRERISLRG
jgi:lipoprotein signal peptidase